MNWENDVQECRILNDHFCRLVLRDPACPTALEELPAIHSWAKTGIELGQGQKRVGRMHFQA